MTQTLRLIEAACLLALLSACDALEPYNRAGTWHPVGTYDANLAAMIVDPADLVRGRDPGPADGLAAATAVDRLRQNHVKPLLDVGSATPAAAVSAN